MKLTIRKSKLSEVPIVNKLGNGLVDYHVKIYTKDDAYYNRKKKNANTVWKRFVNQQNKSKKGLVLLAFDDEKPIGYCISLIKKNIPLFKINEYGYISDLYVKNDYQRKGVGKKLINKSKKFFKKQKIKYLELTTNHNNYEAIKFYQKYGFKEYSKHLRMRI